MQRMYCPECKGQVRIVKNKFKSETTDCPCCNGRTDGSDLCIMDTVAHQIYIPKPSASDVAYWQNKGYGVFGRLSSDGTIIRTLDQIPLPKADGEEFEWRKLDADNDCGVLNYGVANKRKSQVIWKGVTVILSLISLFYFSELFWDDRSSAFGELFFRHSFWLGGVHCLH